MGLFASRSKEQKRNSCHNRYVSVSSRPASARTSPSLSQQVSFPHLALLLNKANFISFTNTFNAFNITTTGAFVEGELASRLRRPQACRLLPPPFPCRGCCVNFRLVAASLQNLGAHNSGAACSEEDLSNPILFKLKPCGGLFCSSSVHIHPRSCGMVCWEEQP